jgi:adenylyltransferase/sulfurtransferase
MELYEEVSVVSHVLPIQRLGIGFVSEFDLVIGALDNREARAWVNQACRKLSLHWIDGAIEGLRGLARMFGPLGPCYACTLSESDYKQMSHRKSCALLAPEDILEGKTPTNASTASVIAAIQVQEAIKYLVGRPESLSLLGKAWMFTGDYMDAFISKYQEDEYCLAHDVYEHLRESKAESPLELVVESGLSGDDIVIDFEDELVSLLPCSKCGNGLEMLSMRSSLPPGRGRCSCGSDFPGSFSTSLSMDSPHLKKTFIELGLANKDVVTVRTNSDRKHYVVFGKK